MSHYLGLVIVDLPTQEKLDAALADYEQEKWDWYRPGGRWDGWLRGDEEMQRRETHDGFNFADENKSIERNCCQVRDLPPDRSPYFFVADYSWVQKELFVAGYPHGRFEENTHYAADLLKLRADKPDAWAIVVDVHN